MAKFPMRTLPSRHLNEAGTLMIRNQLAKFPRRMERRAHNPQLGQIKPYVGPESP